MLDSSGSGNDVVNMSMLAGPRRKQKLSADPRGNAWSKDESKFGQKLLEKFGWSKGKGLGANEDGNVDHVKISVKNNTRGVGCSRNQADNWIAHQDDFNDLLSSLNQDIKVNNDNSNDEEASLKVTGLEKQSKASRSRVHYQKFTKGKDLSSKSREDMACIFGRRKIKPEEEFTPSSEDDDSSSDTQNKSEHGVMTVKSTDSVQDYFAKKMAERKAAVTSKDIDDQSEDERRPGFDMDTDTVNNEAEGDKSVKKKVRFSLGGDDEELNVDTSKTKKKKSKKSKKIKNNEEENNGNTTGDSKEGESAEGCDVRDSEKSERKRRRSSESQVDEEAQVVKSKKQKKGKKGKNTGDIDTEHTVETDEPDSSANHMESETKISKRKQEKLLSETKVESDEENKVKSKKRKKSKKVKDDVCGDDSESKAGIDKSNIESVKSKKKKKRKHKPIVD